MVGFPFMGLPTMVIYFAVHLDGSYAFIACGDL